MIAAVRLIHPFPALVVVITSWLLLLVASSGHLQAETVMRAVWVVALSQIAVGALNDYHDRFADARVQPDKPIPAGLISPVTTLIIALVSLSILVPLAASFGFQSFLLVAIGTGAGIAYDLGLKSVPLSFLAYVIAFLTLVTWIWLIAGALQPPFFLIYLPGSLLLVSAHLANALPDIETDRRLGQRGLAALLGPQRAFDLSMRLFWVVGFLSIIAAAIARSPVALLLVIAGMVLSGGAWTMGHERSGEPARRDASFRFMAPAIGVLALGTLVAFTRLTGFFSG